MDAPTLENRYEVEVLGPTFEQYTWHSDRRKAKWQFHNLRNAAKHLHHEVNLYDLQENTVLNVKLAGTTEMAVRGTQGRGKSKT